MKDTCIRGFGPVGTNGNLYAEREVDSPELMAHYMRHVDRMTVEGLHAKSDIAAELAYRDAQIAALQAERDALRDEKSQLDGYWRVVADELESECARLRESITNAAEAKQENFDFLTECLQMTGHLDETQARDVAVKLLYFVVNMKPKDPAAIDAMKEQVKA